MFISAFKAAIWMVERWKRFSLHWCANAMQLWRKNRRLVLRILSPLSAISPAFDTGVSRPEMFSSVRFECVELISTGGEDYSFKWIESS